MIEWHHNYEASTWELYVDGSFKDRIKVEYSLISSCDFYYRGDLLWMDLDAAKKELEDFYAS
mgnify:CR=1 FL=1